MVANNAIERFNLQNRTVIITGGAGLLGRKHAEAVIEGEGIPILLDISQDAINKATLANAIYLFDNFIFLKMGC